MVLCVARILPWAEQPGRNARTEEEGKQRDDGEDQDGEECGEMQQQHKEEQQENEGSLVVGTSHSLSQLPQWEDAGVEVTDGWWVTQPAHDAPAT